MDILLRSSNKKKAKKCSILNENGRARKFTGKLIKIVFRGSFDPKRGNAEKSAKFFWRLSVVL